MSPASPANEIFQQYLVSSEADAEDLLARLVVDFAQPLVARVIRRRVTLSGGISAEDVEDVCSEALLCLVARLRELRARAASVEIADFESYAGGLAAHAAFRFFARRFPERSRLRSRLRYVLSTDSRFTISKMDSGALLCGLSGRSASRPAIGAGGVEQAQRSLRRHPLPAPLSSTLFTVLSALPGSIELGELTSLIADLMGVDDRASSLQNLAATLADSRPAHSHNLELRESLGILWSEIAELPVSQRIALLLNLRSTTGACVWLFVELRIAGFRELAACLGLAVEELAALWNRLPLDDNEIAERWNWQRQQVINLRSAARQRLTRRMESRARTGANANTMANRTTS